MAISMVGSVILFMFVVNNSWMYKSPVAKVLAVHNNGNKQSIELRLENGSDKGKTVYVKNKYDKSQVTLSTTTYFLMMNTQV